ncbi:MAG: selenide, water dikinase SelD [Flavobacteriales bacterium]|nr:selenide, water dikinase SelD [Flavobacteriales bacterium]
MQQARSAAPLRLTQYSHAAGCGCKIAPAELDRILKGSSAMFLPEELVVGGSDRDDAAVLDRGDGTALISTVDFFSPIVDDPFEFGRIAGANALSDVYAMGGTPLMAVAVLGWPMEKLSPELASRVVDGGRSICMEAGIPLAGGHSIDAPEPFFGLAVTGMVDLDGMKRNDTPEIGDVLYLTRPIGTGVLSTALKRGLLEDQGIQVLHASMGHLNRIGMDLGGIGGVHAMTDVTGFGLFGHLIEMCSDHASVDLNGDLLPLLPAVAELIQQGCYADGAMRNWRSYHDRISGASDMKWMMAGSDPQTNGGLLIALDIAARDEFIHVCSAHGIDAIAIGTFTEKGEKTINVVTDRG